MSGFGLQEEVQAASNFGGYNQQQNVQPSNFAGYGLQQEMQTANTQGYGLQQEVQGNLAPQGYGLGQEIRGQESRTAGPGIGYGLQNELVEAQENDYGLESDMYDQHESYGLQQDMRTQEFHAPGSEANGYGLQTEIGTTQSQGYGLESDMQYNNHASTLAVSVPFEPPFPAEPPLECYTIDQFAQKLRNPQELETLSTATYVDLKEAALNFSDALAVKRNLYIDTLELSAVNGSYPPNCKPSLLQTKLKQGRHKLQALLQPTLAPDGQTFVDLSYSAEGVLEPDLSRVWQFGMTFVKVDGIGQTGLAGKRSPCLYVARMCLFDRKNNRFFGNVMGVRPRATNHKDTLWTFNEQERIIVRCNAMQSDPQQGTHMIQEDYVSLYLEFNISYRLTVEDTRTMPSSEVKANKMVDEINTCWAMLSFRRCSEVARELQVSVPLYCGSLYEPRLLDDVYKEKYRKKGLMKLLSKPKDKPIFTFRASPLPPLPSPVMPYNFMPPTMLAYTDLATCLAAYRMNLALQLARQPHAFSAVSEPVLAAFPHVLGDHHILREFLAKWRDASIKLVELHKGGFCVPDVDPPIVNVVEAFRRCVLEVSPLVYCHSIPPRHINNFVEYQGHRLHLIQAFCHVVDPKTLRITGSRHPVEPLSHAGLEYLHKPFNTSETRLAMGELFQSRWG